MGRITTGKEIVQFSCKLETDPDLWDARAGRVNGKSRHARKVNSEIDKINVAVNARYREIVSVRGEATADEVKNFYHGNASPQETLLKVFREQREQYEKRKGVTVAESTCRNYGNSLARLECFINSHYRVSDMPFRQLDYSFIVDYDYYLRIDCRMLPATVLRHMTYLRQIVRIAVRRGLIAQDPFAGYRPERPKPSQRYVPMEELNRLAETPLESKALEVTRDMFVFSCFTGLSYIDLYNLTGRHIVKSGDGLVWLNISRCKTDSESRIPLLDDALRLIEKYRGSGSGDRVFPMKHSSHMNRQLKKIAALCGIERRLTFHMSRHTFATETCLSQGVSIESVSRMMGHKKLSTTQIYAKVTHDRINEEMKALSEKLKGMYVLAS